MQCVQVKLELGHRAWVRKDGPTQEGFTHDWCVFVRGPEGSKIEHYVDKVVFYLHDSFRKPKRVFKEPPYQVEESGYAGFHMPIDVYFKNKEEPKKIRFEYNLFLNPEQQPSVNHLRCEKLTFQNPTEDFRKKLLKANGVAISLNHSSHTKESADQSSPVPSHNQTKLVKHPGKEPYKGNSSNRTTPTPQKENKSTPVKDSKHQETRPLQKRMSPSGSDRSLSPVMKKSKVAEDSKHSDKVSSKDKSKPKSHKHRKEKDKEKKRDHSKDPEKKHKSEGKDKLKTSTEMASHVKDAEPLKRKDSESKSGASKPNLASTPRNSGNSSLGTLLAELGDEPESDEELISPLSDDHSPINPFSSHVGSQSATSSPKPQIQKAISKADKQEKSKTNIEPSPSKQKAQTVTPKTSENKVASLSETNVKSKFVKLEGGSSSHKLDVKKEKVEPHREHAKKSSESKKINKHREETKKPVQVKSEMNDNKETKGNTSENPLKSVNGDASRQMQHSTAFNNLSNTSFAGLNDLKAGDGFDLAELLDLQRKLMMLRDRECLQRIVDVVEETGLFDITSTTFDFDLCSLDKATLTKLQKCICDVPNSKHEAQPAKVL